MKKYFLRRKNILCCLIVVIPLLLLNCGGGGGGGKCYPPSIAINTFNIQKSPIVNDHVKITNRQEIKRSRPMDLSDDLVIEGDKYYNFKHVYYKNMLFNIAIPIDYWIAILDADKNIVRKLKTPRYTRDAVAVELNHPKQRPLLAILIDQQSTSRSSTLYVLNSDFIPIYKEHLLQANWISKIESNQGDKLIISTGKSCIVDENIIIVNGDWIYSFFVPSQP